MSKAIDRRILALEAMRPQQATGKHLPRWFIEGQRDERVFTLLHQVAAYDNRKEYGDRCTVPANDVVEAARAELHERFGDEAEQVIAEHGAIWRDLQDEC